MKPLSHIAVSLSLGLGVWFLTKSFFAGVICFFSGFLLDVDHIIEYIIHFGYKDFSLRKCYEVCDQPIRRDGKYQFKRLYIIFHSAEIALLLWIITAYTKNAYIFASALGYSTHLILDRIGNPYHPYFYFILWRALRNFETDKCFHKKRL